MNNKEIQQKINDIYTDEDEKEEEEKVLEEDDFKGYSTIAKYKLFGLFFCLGIFNHLGTILVMTGGRLLAYELQMRDYVPLYTSSSTIFSIITRLINSKLFLKVSYKKRIYFLCFWIMAGYFTMFLVLQLHDTILSKYNALCFVLSFIPCFFLGSSYAFGESAIIAYLRLFPKTLIAGWSSGTGLSSIISGLLNFISQLNDGFSLKYLYLVLTPCGPLYLFIFLLTFHIYESRDRANDVDVNLSLPLTPYENSKDKDNEGKANIAEFEDNNNANGELEEKEREEKEMEKMNKSNKIMNFENLMVVMRMCGEVIINLGIIYFFQFFCTSCLLVRVCQKVDIKFLPKGCSSNHHTYRKGKYEFINIFFQVGIFTAKTFIKLVRKIQPIEIFTGAILIVNIILITEYYKGYIHWGNFIWIMFIHGFFGGGTYSGGFYTILNSEKVNENYKELTVNVATLFNDVGTFLSGIAGLIALKYWLDNEMPFPGEKIYPVDC